MSSNFLLVLSGPSGSGKSTLVKMVLEHYADFTYSISATTRKPRPGEEHGVHYFFVSENEFKRMIEADELIEWAHVYNTNYYGTPRSFITETLQQSNIIVDADVQGGLQIMDKIPDAEFVFIQTSDLEELENRIRKRGSMNPEELESRLATARKELTFKNRYNYVITNDNLDDAFHKLQDIIERHKAASQ